MFKKNETWWNKEKRNVQFTATWKYKVVSLLELWTIPNKTISFMNSGFY